MKLSTTRLLLLYSIMPIPGIPVHVNVVGIGGKCVDVQGGAPYNQAPLILSTCNGSPSQQWRVH